MSGDLGGDPACWAHLFEEFGGEADDEATGSVHQLRGDTLALVPRGARRELRAGPSGLAYLSIHRRRRALTIDRPGDSKIR